MRIFQILFCSEQDVIIDKFKTRMGENMIVGLHTLGATLRKLSSMYDSQPMSSIHPMEGRKGGEKRDNKVMGESKIMWRK